MLGPQQKQFNLSETCVVSRCCFSLCRMVLRCDVGDKQLKKADPWYVLRLDSCFWKNTEKGNLDNISFCTAPQRDIKGSGTFHEASLEKFAQTLIWSDKSNKGSFFGMS